MKKVLNKYRTDVDDQYNVKALLKTGRESACSVDELKKTLIYLNTSETNLEDFRKKGLAEMIVIRMNELLHATNLMLLVKMTKHLFNVLTAIKVVAKIVEKAMWPM